MIRVEPPIFTATDERAYDRAMSTRPRWRAYFTNGERWEFHADDHAAAWKDAHFWADFTGREFLALAGL